MNDILKASLFIALICPATVDAQPAAGRLDRAAELSRSAAGAGSLEQARSLSSTALDAAPKFDGDVVDASGAAFAPAASKQVPALTFAPARSLAAQVPAPARFSSRGDGGGHASAFMIAGALSPLVGACAPIGAAMALFGRRRLSKSRSAPASQRTPRIAPLSWGSLAGGAAEDPAGGRRARGRPTGRPSGVARLSPAYGPPVSVLPGALRATRARLDSGSEAGPTRPKAERPAAPAIPRVGTSRPSA